MRYCFLPGLLFILTCCTRKEKYSDDKIRLYWQSFSLISEDTNMVICNIMSDSLEIRNSNNKTKLYFIEKNKRDSLFYWANGMIEYKEPDIINTCSDYVGKLTIKIRYSPTLTKHAYFTAICDWREINNETRKIDSLLNTVIKH